MQEKFLKKKLKSTYPIGYLTQCKTSTNVLGPAKSRLIAPKSEWTGPFMGEEGKSGRGKLDKVSQSYRQTDLQPGQ